MDTQKQLGRLLGEHEEASRDAIHIAVLPVFAGETLHAGRAVTLAYGTNNIAINAKDEYGVYKSIGIVDPFLKDPWCVEKGQRFWLYLNPNTVTGMRHHWELAAVDKPQVPQNDAEKWLRSFAERWGFDYDELISVATHPDAEWAYITAHGRDLHHRSELGDDYNNFWENLSALTGQAYGDVHKDKVGWSCSC